VMLLLLGETADALHKAQRVGEVGALECAGDPGSIVDEIPVGRLPAVIFGLLARKRRDTTSARRARPFSKVGGHPAFLLAAIEEGTTRAIIKRQPAFGGRWRHSCSVVYGCGMHFGLFSRLRRVEQTGTRGAAQAGVGSGNRISDAAGAFCDHSGADETVRAGNPTSAAEYWLAIARQPDSRAP
jgi:hypothetical protein